MLDFRPYIFVHENVCQFPDSIIERALSAYYEVETIVVNSLDCGLPISRKRKYTLCRLRSKLELHDCCLYVFEHYGSDPLCFVC